METEDRFYETSKQALRLFLVRSLNRHKVSLETTHGCIFQLIVNGQ